LALATFVVWRLRSGACGVGAFGVALVVFGAIECPPSLALFSSLVI